MTQAVYPVIGRQDRLPFYLTGIGISDPEYRVAREKGLVSHQFLFTSSGAGVLTVDDQNTYSVQARYSTSPPQSPTNITLLRENGSQTGWCSEVSTQASLWKPWAFRALPTPTI